MSGLTIVFCVFAILLFLNVPIAYTLGLAAVAYVSITGKMSLTSFASVMITSVDSFPLIAIPFFILAGAFMSSGGISRRIVDFAMTLVGNVKGGLAMVAVLACAFFAALSGSGIATTAAICAIMLPEMKKQGYDVATSAAIIAAAGCLGPIIPPSIPFVMFGASTDTSISALLMGGILPGLLLAGVLLVGVYFYARKKNIAASTEKFSLRLCLHEGIVAFPALMVPIIILGGIYSGIFTPTESASIAVVYSAIIGKFLYKELNFKNFKEALIDAGTQTGGILIIAAAATFFARILTIEQFHVLLHDFVLGATTSKYAILLMLNVVLLMLGCIMDTTPIILVFAPILLPIATAVGVHPVQFGIMMCANLAIGLITPPVGVSLYIAAGQARVPFLQIAQRVWPYLIMMLIGLLIITYVPDISLVLPRLMDLTS